MQRSFPQDKHRITFSELLTDQSALFLTPDWKLSTTVQSVRGWFISSHRLVDARHHQETPDTHSVWGPLVIAFVMQAPKADDDFSKWLGSKCSLEDAPCDTQNLPPIAHWIIHVPPCILNHGNFSLRTLGHFWYDGNVSLRAVRKSHILQRLQNFDNLP